MEFFTKAKAVRLKSHLDKYLIADDDQISARQRKSGATKNARWLVELVDNNRRVVRLKSHHNLYLTATTGHKVVQTLQENRTKDPTIEWEPIRDGFQVKMIAFDGTYLRANGGTPPWRNSVTHDVPTHDWVLWDVEAVEVPDDEDIADYLSIVSRFSSISDEISGLDFEFRSPVAATPSPRLSVIKVRFQSFTN